MVKYMRPMASGWWHTGHCKAVAYEVDWVAQAGGLLLHLGIHTANVVAGAKGIDHTRTSREIHLP